jgi:phage gp29-like protein
MKRKTTNTKRTPTAKTIVVKETAVSSMTNKTEVSKAIPQKTEYVQTLLRTAQNIETWKSAMSLAESAQFPNRTELYRLYKDILLDNHVSSLIETRKRAILSSKFNVVNANGEVYEEKTKQIVKKKWFHDCTGQILDSIYQGTTLIHFDDLVDGVFKGTSIVPREFVKPEFGCIVQNFADTTGQNYLSGELSDWILPIGGKFDFGLLVKIAPMYIFKKGAFASWSQFISAFGVPLRVGKTNTRDEPTRRQMEEALIKIAGSAYGLLDLEDEIQIIESKSTDAYNCFNALIERCNSEISKILVGSLLAEEKKYIGANQMHENLYEMICTADRVWLESIYESQLIPFLNNHNFGLEGCRIEVQQSRELSLIEKSKIDIALLNYYEIPPEYIEQTYGTPVIPRVKDNSIPQLDEETKIRLARYYGE